MVGSTAAQSYAATSISELSLLGPNQNMLCPALPPGAVVVVFEYAEHAANMVVEHHRCGLRRALDAALCGATATAPRLASRRVGVRRCAGRPAT
jgi:hypothetical protein